MSLCREASGHYLYLDKILPNAATLKHCVSPIVKRPHSDDCACDSRLKILLDDVALLRIDDLLAGESFDAAEVAFRIDDVVLQFCTLVNETIATDGNADWCIVSILQQLWLLMTVWSVKSSIPSYLIELGSSKKLL